MGAHRASDRSSDGLSLPTCASSPLRVDVVVMPDRRSVLLKVAGEIDALSGDVLRSGLGEASRLAPRVVVDLSGVTFMDSTGLNVLLGAYRSLGQNPEALVLRSPSTVVSQVLKLTRLDDLFTIDDSTLESAETGN